MGDAFENRPDEGGVIRQMETHGVLLDAARVFLKICG
jgi:hypothetical protein